MTTDTHEPVAGDVSERYAHPEDIIQDQSLTRDQKIGYLQEWEQDLRQLMVASEENMPGTVTGQPADSLKAVSEALEKLGADADKKDSPAKSG
ncbi:hypothetical protein [Emcibacter sp. SYSU 3D8]|uniref:hypothetical protein n=1 Tax=Emcibacter sp. SYSU 3D8 TaxID=3133969 RepID=UPI0031FE56FC